MSRPSPRSPPTPTTAPRRCSRRRLRTTRSRAAEQEAYFSRLADAAALPLVIYNIPVYTKIQIAPAVAAALASHPRVAGLKDSGRDLGYATELLDAGSRGWRRRGLLRPDRHGLDARLLHAGRCPWHHLRERQRRARVGARRLRGGQGRQAGRRAAARGPAPRGAGRAQDRAPPAGYKAAIAAAGVGEPWLVPPRRPLTEAETALLIERLTALDVLLRPLELAGTIEAKRAIVRDPG